MERRPYEKEPLSGERVVPRLQCDAEAPVAVCMEEMPTAGDAAHALLRPECTTRALNALKSFALTDNDAAVDLVAAYYVRAQRDDRPSDFLRAFAAAQEALKVRRDSPELRFNLALTYEALGLSEEAKLAWTAYLSRDSRSEWAKDAQAHLARLTVDPEEREEARTKRAQAPMLEALRRGDAAALDRAIDAFPQVAQRYLDEGLLGDWGSASSAQSLTWARRLAEALNRRSKDAFPLAVVTAIERASPEQLQALKRGHANYARGRAEKRTDLLQTASSDLAQGGSPFRIMADARVAAALASAGASPAAVIAQAVIDESTPRHYLAPLHIAQATRGSIASDASRFVESLRMYEAAVATSRELRDTEKIAENRARRNGALSLLGDQEGAWREIYAALHGMNGVAVAKERTVILGQAAETALLLGFPGAAFDYQNFNLRFAQKEPAYLVSALRARARMEVQLDRAEDAKHDLNAGFDLARNMEQRQSFESRLNEIKGQFLRKDNPATAARAFLDAYRQSDGENETYKARVLLQAAEAELDAGRPADADAHFRDAIALLRTEEAGILAHHSAGDGEQFWSSYFSRFQDAYRGYAQHAIETHDPDEAFRITEQARASEPLDLLTKRGAASKALRGLTPAEVGKRLPPDTFLLEYLVLNDRTYVWILSRDAAPVPETLSAGREDIERWTSALQGAANNGDVASFEAGLYAPYRELIQRPLGIIRTLHPQGPPRLVIVPDLDIHGLPIAALREPGTKEGQFLLQQTSAIEIAASSAVYLSSLDRDRALRPTSSPSILLVGDPAFDPRSSLFRGYGRLAGASREVDGIAAWYGSAADVRKGAEATPGDFIARVRDKEIVHVAAHAIVNVEEPYASVLVLAAANGEEGALTAHELLQKNGRLDRTRLVVLSACSSAGGVAIGPEGVGPLVRPWIAAGVPGVIGSLWNVRDATAGRLLVSFHQHYRVHGDDAAAALHRAQLDLLRQQTPGLRSAISWGAFQMIGHASPPIRVAAPP